MDKLWLRFILLLSSFSFVLFLPFSYFEYEISVWLWRINLMIFNILNRFLFYKSALKFFQNDYIKTNLALVFYSLSIVNFYDIINDQRNQMVLTLILCIYLRKEKEIDLVSIVIFNLIIAIHPYFILIYLIYIILPELNLKKILIHILTFTILNFFIFFFIPQYLDIILSLRSRIAPQWWEYIVFGVILLIIDNFQSYYSFIAIIFMLLCCMIFIIRNYKQKPSIINISIFFSIISIIFNIFAEYHHFAIFNAFLILYLCNQIHERKVILLIALCLTALPIPHLFFEMIGLIQIAYLKRVIVYLLYPKLYIKPKRLKLD